MNLLDCFRRGHLRQRCIGVASRLILPVVILLLSATVTAAAPTISIEPPYEEVQEHGTVWLEVKLNEEVLGLTGYHLVIDFDESVLDVVDVEKGDLPLGYAGDTFMEWTDEGTASSALDVSGAMLGGSVDGPGVLVRVQFAAIDRGSSPVEFTLVDLRDIDNQPIDVSPQDGELQVVPIAHVYFEPSHSEVGEFEHFWVDVCFDEWTEDVTGYDFVVHFDTTLVYLVNAEEGDLPQGYPGETFFYWTADEDLNLVVNGAFLGGSVDGPGSVVRIEFKARAAGVSDLSFLSLDLRDIDNAPIPHVGEAGDVEIALAGRVYVEPEHQSGFLHEEICVDVAIDELVEGLTGFHLLIDFDEAYLEVASVTRTGLMAAHPGSTALYWYAEGQPSDALLVDGAFLGSSVDGPGSLFTLCFNALQIGESPVDFVEVEFRDLDNNVILVGSRSGRVFIDPPVNVEPTTWGAIKAMYR